MQHFVIENVAHDIFGHILSVELAIDYDLFERGVEAAQLRPPHAIAPAQPRFHQ